QHRRRHDQDHGHARGADRRTPAAGNRRPRQAHGALSVALARFALLEGLEKGASPLLPMKGGGGPRSGGGASPADPSGPSVSSPSASIRLPTKWGGDAASAALRCAPEGRLVLRHRLALHGFLGRGGAGCPAE